VVTARLHSAAALVALLLVGFAGESAAWHDHPLDSGELAPSHVSVVDDSGRCGPSEHVDRGHDVLRGACVACIHSSRPGAFAAPGGIRSSLPSDPAVRSIARTSRLEDVEPGLEPVRGPPAPSSPRIA